MISIPVNGEEQEEKRIGWKRNPNHGVTRELPITGYLNKIISRETLNCLVLLGCSQLSVTI